MDDARIFQPSLITGEQITQIYQPYRRARAIGYISSVACALVGTYLAAAHYPEWSDVAQAFRSNQVTAEVGWGLGYFFGGASLAIGGWAALISKEVRMATHRTALTTKRILQKTGIIRRDIQSINYVRVTDTAVHQGLCARLTDTGTILVSTAGSSGYEMSLDDIGYPHEASKTILERHEESWKEAERSGLDAIIKSQE